MTDDGKKRVQVKLDSRLNSEVSAVLVELGISPTTMITALYKRVAAEGKIPFEFKLTDDEKARLDLAKAVYDLNVPTLTDPAEIQKYLAEDDEED
ncbi:type II toxin-antitoxin system RelB/DinJ family antitoxin [Lentilactobacillus hilgardii]|nr:type II toxin-antitoxin system RelB/DinJ family antitoxin [Lentilactobacillus hilgardii]MCV3740756.1 type II toxin-antitoxin system RelB/DinJ family antitoxin [Lentilactobacillus hilgardii]